MSGADADLERAYRRARYRVRLPGGDVDMRVDRTEPALVGLLASGAASGAALITAHNPRSRRRTAAQNADAEARLQAQVRAAGYPCHATEALDPDGRWPAEPGLLILGMSRADALALARGFDQNAILYVDADGTPRLLWTGVVERPD